MMKRTFQHRVTPLNLACIVVVALLALWYFWLRMPAFAVLAFVLVVLDVAVIEVVVHTTYTLTPDGHLVIYRGRFCKATTIPLEEIIEARQVRTWWPSAHYVLLVYGPHRQVGVQPDNEEGFIGEINRRQKRLENDEYEATEDNETIEKNEE